MNQMLKPEVGSIVYLLNPSSHSLIPALVIEEITSRTINGTERRHIVDPGNGRTLKLEETSNPYFLDLDSARSFLLEAATKIVDAAIARANKDASILQPKPHAELFAEDVSNIRVDLGNGQTARVRINLPQEAQ
jgi:hypothetical protein